MSLCQNDLAFVQGDCASLLCRSSNIPMPDDVVSLADSYMFSAPHDPQRRANEEQFSRVATSDTPKQQSPDGSLPCCQGEGLRQVESRDINSLEGSPLRKTGSAETRESIEHALDMSSMVNRIDATLSSRSD